MSTISSTSAITGAITGGGTATSSTESTATTTLLADATLLRQASTRLAEVQIQLSRAGTALATSVEAFEEEPTEDKAEAVKQVVGAAQQALGDAAAALDLPPPAPVAEAPLDAAVPAGADGADGAVRGREPQWPLVPGQGAFTLLAMPGPVAAGPGMSGLVGMGMGMGVGPGPGLAAGTAA